MKYSLQCKWHNKVADFTTESHRTVNKNMENMKLGASFDVLECCFKLNQKCNKMQRARGLNWMILLIIMYVADSFQITFP